MEIVPRRGYGRGMAEITNLTRFRKARARADKRRQGDENAALHLAKVPGIDAILTGHQHLVFPGKDFANIDGVDAAALLLGDALEDAFGA